MGSRDGLSAEATLVPDSGMAETYFKLGYLFSDHGKLALAEEMYKRALGGYEKVLGKENTMVYILALNIMWRLGALYESQDDIPKARKIYLRAFARYEKVIGPDH